METRSKLRSRSSGSSASSKSPDDEKDETSGSARCDECDCDIIPGEGIQFDSDWYCKKHSPLKGSLPINQTEGCSINTSLGHSGYGRTTSIITIFIGALSVIIIVIGYVFSSQLREFFPFSIDNNSVANSGLNCKNETNIFNYINNYKEMFPSQLEDSWFTFATGIHRIYTTKPTEPTSFLLFHEDGDETANCLVKEISKLASECLTGNRDIIDLKSKDLSKELEEDSGELMTRYGSKITEKNVMVVRDINELPGEIVKEFHYLCDTYQPFVNKAIYFFTMKTNAKIKNKYKIISKVEDSFRQIWGKSLDYSVLDPLISRMVSFVIPVISEERFKVRGC